MPSKKAKTIIITILLTTVLGGTGAYSYFSKTPSSSPSSPTSSSSENTGYNSIKNQVNLLSQKLGSNPNDISLQQDLGNAYYDLATIAQKVAPNEAREDYLQAIKYYQSVLNAKQDINVLTDMATAAFYSEQYDLAEKSYKEALAKSPNFTQAYFNYGVFLLEVKKDASAAISLWQTALDKEPTGPNADRLKQIITQTKEKLTSQR